MTRLVSLTSVLVLCAIGTASPAANVKQLAKRYRDFLGGPTSYLITKVERKSFLNLATDEERDRAIERFWEARNPTPGMPSNEFKDEFYRRLAYVNAHYGLYNGTEGWRSDQGKTYLLFGRPRTSMNYSSDQELHPTELWFYSNPGLSEIPPFFYVVFYEPDDVSGYRLYNPLTDGPDKLIREEPSKAQAYDYLRGVSAELARASLTLIPGEPIDTDTYSGSMESVQILNAIQGFRNMPSYVSMILTRQAQLERVKSRVEYDIARTSLITFVAREQGDPWLHWRFEISDPLQAKAKDGRVKYDIAARVYSHGQLVFERTDSPGFAVPAGNESALNKRPFVYQDRMPLAPGAYRLAVTAKCQATGRVYESSREVQVPAPTDRSAATEILVISGHEKGAPGVPFSFGDVRFMPAFENRIRATTGLNILYQVVAGQPSPAELEVEYVIANAATKFRKTLTDKLDMTKADAAGTLLTAKTLPIEDLSPGSYQLALRIKDPQTGRITGRAAAFTVIGSEEDPHPIVISRGATETPQWIAVNQYERALCWLAQDRPLEAVANLEASWKLNQNPVTRGLLQHLYERTGQKKSLN